MVPLVPGRGRGNISRSREGRDKGNGFPLIERGFGVGITQKSFSGRVGRPGTGCPIPGGVPARLDRALDTLGYLESALSTMASLGEVLEAGFSWMPEMFFLVFFILGVKLVLFHF